MANSSSSDSLSVLPPWASSSVDADVVVVVADKCRRPPFDVSGTMGGHSSNDPASSHRHPGISSPDPSRRLGGIREHRAIVVNAVGRCSVLRHHRNHHLVRRKRNDDGIVYDSDAVVVVFLLLLLLVLLLLLLLVVVPRRRRRLRRHRYCSWEFFRTQVRPNFTVRSRST